MSWNTAGRVVLRVWSGGDHERLRGPSRQARALAALGRNEDARRAYEDLFALWRDADAHLSALERAKAEYAALR